jgi:hypothetical protein
MNTQNCIVKVTTYENYLIIESDPETMNEDWVPYGGSKFGCVIVNTNEHLGISSDALEILKKVKRSSDAIGDVDAWKTSDGIDCFSWIGPCKHIIPIDSLEGSRDYDISTISYIDIPNDPPPVAINIIDLSLKHRKLQHDIC